MSLEDFIGTWKLVSLQLQRGDTINYPFGEEPDGFITYSSEGWMSAFVAPENRTLFKSRDMMGGSDEEKVAAVETFVSYCGRFEVLSDRVVHHVEMSLFPNWVGEKQERFYKFEDDQLTLSTAPLLLYGEMQSAHLVWEKHTICL
jgi:hypothetical protein